MVIGRADALEVVAATMHAPQERQRQPHRQQLSSHMTSDMPASGSE